MSGEERTGPFCTSRRWGPLSGGKRRALLRQILVPDRCKRQDHHAGLEKWEELVRRYERSKSSGTTTAALDEDVKTAALEVLVPRELEQHLAMKRARRISFEVKSSPTVKPAKVNSHPRQLWQRTPQIRWRWTALAKEAREKGKKGKGDGKNGKKEGQKQNQNPNPSKDVVCGQCGKKGHLVESKESNQSGSGGIQNKGDKRKTEERHRQRSRLCGT